MNKILAFSLLGIGIILAIYFGIAQSSNPTRLDVNGIWEDSNSSSFKNAVLILSEKDGQVTMAHYLEWKGNKFVESGTGKRVGDSIIYKANVTLPIEGWATQGSHELKLSEDGNTLKGIYKDNTGKSGPIVFKRKK